MAIAGGGVAGAALAVVLARAGITVAVIERERRFRDRVRGDCLFPWGATEAAQLGLAAVLPQSGARPLPIWQPYEQGEVQPPYDWRSDTPHGDVVWGVDHPQLQECLLQLAEQAGARIIRGAKALAPEHVSGGELHVPVFTSGTQSVIQTRLVIGADGSQSGARRWVGAVTTRDPTHHWLAGCLLERVDLDPDAAHVSRYEGGMALLFRHGSGRVRAYLVCRPESARALRGGNLGAYLEILQDVFPAGAFARAVQAGPLGVFPAIDTYPDRVAGEGIVLIGDAAGANDPAQGQGLALALRDVRELSGLLLAERDWQTAIATFAQRRERWYAPLRAYARWQGPLVSDVGDAADAARERARSAAERDSWRYGYGGIQAFGPDGLPVTEAARRHFLGLDLDEEMLVQ